MSALPPIPGVAPPELDAALARCEEIAAHDQSNLWLVSQFLQDRARYEAFISMYAVMRVVDDRVDALPGPEALGAAERRRVLDELDRWEARIGAALSGRAGAAGADPLDTALAAAAVRFPAPAVLWTNFLRAMRFDVDHDRIDTRERFLDYAEGATAAPTTLYVYLLAANRDPQGRYTLPPSADGFELLACGRNLGLFAYLAHILRDVAKDLRLGERGRIYLPLEDLTAAGLSESDYGEIVSRGRGEARWDRLVALVLARARAYEAEGAALARRRFPVMDPDCRFILSLIIRTYGQLLDRIEADPRCMLQGDIPLAGAEAIAAAAAETGWAPAG
jgi:phytoene synthase